MFTMIHHGSGQQRIGKAPKNHRFMAPRLVPRISACEKGRKWELALALLMRMDSLRRHGDEDEAWENGPPNYPWHCYLEDSPK